jgi:hypothetical protein
MNTLLRKIGAKLSTRSNAKPPITGEVDREQYTDLQSLIDNHFASHSDVNHPCRPTMSLALEMLNQKPAVIVETGSSAWGTNSSLLFDSYVNSFGGSFHSVDIRPEPAKELRSLCSSKSQFFCNDSVGYLKELAKTAHQLDLLYLDSWDVDWQDPLPSAMHGLHEFLSIYPTLKPGSLVLIDDTPSDSSVISRVQPMHAASVAAFLRTYGFSPGKGGLIKEFLSSHHIGKEIAHDYQLLWML